MVGRLYLCGTHASRSLPSWRKRHGSTQNHLSSIGNPYRRRVAGTSTTTLILHYDLNSFLLVIRVILNYQITFLSANSQNLNYETCSRQLQPKQSHSCRDFLHTSHENELAQKKPFSIRTFSPLLIPPTPLNSPKRKMPIQTDPYL